MDIVTTAITAALAAGATQGVGTVSTQVIVDTYNALKSSLLKKFSGNDNVLQAVKELEHNPASEEYQYALAEQITNDPVDSDLQNMAQNLLEALARTSEGRDALGKYKVQADKIGVVGDNSIFHGNINL